MIGGACVFLLLATSVRAEKDDRPPPTIGHVTVLPLVSVGVADLTSGHLPELVELMEHGTSAALATRALFAPTPQLALDRLGLGDAIRRGRVRIGGRTSAGSTLLPDIGSKARTRVDYLRDVNRAIARERAALPPDTILVVIGLPRSPRSFVLTPLVVFGPGIPTGQFVSASTRRTGIATPQDLSATVARIIGTPDPAGGGLAAAPLRISPGPSPIGVLARIDADALLQGSANRPAVNSWILVGSIVLLAGVAMALVPGGRHVEPVHRVAIQVFAAWPVSTFLVGAWPGHPRDATAHITATWLAAAVVGAGTLLVGRNRQPTTALLLLASGTMGVIAADLVSGGRLQSSTLLGTSPAVGARFYGLGNASFGVLAGAAIVASVLTGRTGWARVAGVEMSTIILVLTLVVIGAPSIGADAGGALAFTPAAVLVFLHLSGKRPSALAIAGAIVAGAAAVAVSAGLDLFTGGTSRTHIGRFVGLVPSDPDLASAIAHHRWSGLASRLGGPWLALVGVLALAVGVRWIVQIRRSAARVEVVGPALIGLAAASTLGVLVNDSGISVGALVLCWAGPLIAPPGRLRGPGRTEHPRDAPARPAPLPSGTAQPAESSWM